MFSIVETSTNALLLFSPHAESNLALYQLIPNYWYRRTRMRSRGEGDQRRREFQGIDTEKRGLREKRGDTNSEYAKKEIKRFEN